MTGFLQLAFAYVLGGLTFLPLVILAIFAHIYYTSPVVDPATARQRHHDSLQSTGDNAPDLSKLPAELQKPDRERDAAAGYFAISREYVSGGVNGKPPDRLTPAGEVIVTESPSVYQSMYRSIFERNKAQGPSLEGSSAGLKTTKKARNVFYVVLRLGHLMLYDNADQLEVRHVISLGLYEVDIYGGGERIPEGELWVKRNCIRLQMRDTDYTLRDSKPYYLFSDNCSDKEDFYHALIQNQHRSSTKGEPPIVPLKFEADHMVKLVQQLHGSEELMTTRWFNALVGRIFLAMYKTSYMQAFIHAKIMKKLTRIQTPSFIEHIKVGRIDMGNAAPLFTNQKLRELTLDGELILEMDVKYSGNFRLEIAAQVLIDLGKRFNVRRIDILLSGLLKSLEGRLLIKIKPPPCNRIWISFETMPKMDLSIEPIVSSRQITYGIILRTIESRIREVLGETLVSPNWDDIPFSHTEGDAVRGGLWEFHAAASRQSDHASMELSQEKEKGKKEDTVEAVIETLPKSHSTPALVKRRAVGNAVNSKTKSSKSQADVASVHSGREIPTSPNRPNSMRSSSFASTSPPMVSMSPTHANAFREDGKGSLPDAASAMKGFSRRSSSTSLTPLPAAHDTQAADHSFEADDSLAARDPEDQDVFDLEMPGDDLPRSDTEPQHSHARKNGSKTSINIEGFGTPNLDGAHSKKSKTFVASAQQVATATAAARKWGYDFVAKRASTNLSNGSNESTPDLSSIASVQSMPIGRGQPLPPVGTPLPGPQRKNWTTAIGSIGRKKVPSHNVSDTATYAARMAVKGASEATPPLPPRRSTEQSTAPGTPTLETSRKSSQHSKRSRTGLPRGSADGNGSGSSSDNILVIKAPDTDSEENALSLREESTRKAADSLARKASYLQEDEVETPQSGTVTPSRESTAPSKEEDKTPTQKYGSNINNANDTEDHDTKESDRDSLERLQSLVY